MLDGLIHTDRSHFASKHRAHGMNVQVIASPDGIVRWTSGALPDSLIPERRPDPGILRALEDAGIVTLADKA